MITHKTGNIFSTNCEYLVNPVNCVGIMGAGLALLFKKKYPLMFTQYVNDCNNNIYKPGSVYLYKGLDGNIINFTTKKHYKDPSWILYIENGLKDFINKYNEWNINSVAFPLLGCGLGGLDKNKVIPVMKKYLDPLDIRIEIWEFETIKTRKCCS